MQQRSHWRTDDADFCPVRVWLGIVLRLHGRPDCDATTTINVYHVGDQRLEVSSAQVLTALRSTAEVIGSDELGFEPRDIGTHSICCAAAMVMAILRYPTWQIMITGRWNSDAFMGYIREQVDRLSQGVSASMAAVRDFTTIPTIDPQVVAVPDPAPGVGLHHIDGAPPDPGLDTFPSMASLFHSINEIDHDDRPPGRRHQTHPH